MVPEIVPLVACPKATAPHNIMHDRVKNIVRFSKLIFSVLLECFRDYAIPSFQPIRYLYFSVSSYFKT
jgi:hypothetical protein